MTLDELKEQSPGVLDSLPVDILANLQKQAEAHAADAAQMLAILHSTFTRRYAQGLNDTGTHYRNDGDFNVKITVPKRVDWDAEKLAIAVETIKGWGEDPADYVETKISVTERKYDAWPPAIRDLFTPARTVKAGKAKFELVDTAEREAA